MKSIIIIFCFVAIVSCSKSIDYSPEHIAQTSGRYLLSPDEVLEVYYEENNLLLKWRGVAKVKPVILDENTFFIADMYKKLRFVKHPNDNSRYLSIVSPDSDIITYDYLKVSDSFDIPSVNLRKGNYEKARLGYLEIQKQNPNSPLIEENEFNRLGYNFIKDKKYNDAINVLKINVALFPESSNVYDSLADAYLRNEDSLNAFNNYKIALSKDSKNGRAEKYVNAYEKRQ